MTVDLTVYLTDRPGQLTAVARHLADEGVNIDGYFGLVVGGQGIMHVLLDDDVASSAARTLRDAGFEVRDEQQVVVVDCEDQPGALADRLEPLADAGVNITVSYLATATRLVVGAEDLDQVRDVL
jgi:hypothetical protein